MALIRTELVMLFYLQPAWNVTFLSDSSFLVKEAVFNTKNKRRLDIGLSFQVPPSTRHGLFLLEFHQNGVCQSASIICFTITVKIPHADWLVAIVRKSTDNKKDVTCNARAFSMQNKANPAHTFYMLL